MPVLFIQEGGYRNRYIGVNAKFFKGFYEVYSTININNFHPAILALLRDQEEECDFWQVASVAVKISEAYHMSNSYFNFKQFTIRRTAVHLKWAQMVFFSVLRDTDSEQNSGYRYRDRPDLTYACTKVSGADNCNRA